jgi:hypothetical protein
MSKEKLVDPALKFIKPSEIDTSEFVEVKKDVNTPYNKLTFETYFEVLKMRNPKILEHHKEPIRKFLKQMLNSNTLIATEEEFNELLKKY